MATLLLNLTGPMQSWGTTSRFTQRDTGKEPSKSGVLGLIAAALGIDRDNWHDIENLSRLAMGVRHDRPGIPKRDYQTAACSSDDTIIRADGSSAKDGGVVSERFYLADAAFLVGLSAEDLPLLHRIHDALRNPVWPLSLGRKSYVPSEPVWIQNGVLDNTLRGALTTWPWIAKNRDLEQLPEILTCSFESEDGSGSLRMDQPLSSFAERRYGARFVRTETIPMPLEASNVST